MEKYINELRDFIIASPSPFHAVFTIKTILKNLGFSELFENQKWDVEKGKKYFVIKDDASIIAIKVGKELNEPGFKVVASHNDSPTFKIKPKEMLVSSSYQRFNTEPYGGMLLSTWFDKPLGVAGRVMVKTKDGIASRLVNLSSHSFIIPSLAIHLNRNANSEATFNPQVDMLPLVGLDEKESFIDYLKKLVCFEETDEIVAHDLFLYNKEEPSTIGLKHELIASPKLDDLECVFSSLEAFLEGNNDNDINICAIFDNEEVGSLSNHGAASSFLINTLNRLISVLKLDSYITFANSMLISADNAHAVHPAHPEKSDPNNCVYLNKGVVIKYHAGLSYTTDAYSASIFKALCDKAAVPYQDYTNRSDLRGGSTLGHIALDKFSVTSVDIGLAQLAMHSSYETAGAKDVAYMVKALKEFYSTEITKSENNTIIK